MGLITYGHQTIEQDDLDAVSEVLRSDYLTQGPKVREFEDRLAEYVGARFAVAVNNGTSALLAACNAAGISYGEDVVTTPMTFAATANAIEIQGGWVEFHDIDDTWNISNYQAEVTIPVDFAGRPVDMDTINAPVIIEDACHALGAVYKGRHVGATADMCCYSFHPVKAITTGEGGMVTTNNEVYYERLKTFRDHGRVNGMVEEPGLNLRMSDIQAALGISQLRKLPRFLDRRREIALRYCEAFNVPFVEGHAYHLFVMLFEDRDAERARLLEKGIQTQVHYQSLTRHPYYKGQSCPKAEAFSDHCLSLPIYPLLTDAEVRYVIQCVQEVS
jgi:dTDP-4-amino-4,6-dideoxygalactose transaminase